MFDFMLAIRQLVTSALAGLMAVGPATAQPAGCGFEKSFDRPDEQGTRTIHVYEGKPEAALGGHAPLLFVSSLKVNTDGTRISYKADDPRANHGAINDIRNAYNDFRRPISDFEDLVRANWMPAARVWQVLSRSIIERDRRPGANGKPCLDADNYLVSMTATGAVADAHTREGDCDQSKWIDALTVPAIVLPESTKKIPSQFAARGAVPRSVAIAMTLDENHRLARGVVGDLGPVDELGEASVAMNRALNGLPADDIPKNHSDANNRFQAGRSVLLVFPGKENLVPYPIKADNVDSFARNRFDAWGGQPRVTACLNEIPEAAARQSR